ncbi:Hsp20/alpha crystallin family protein [Siminovitchia sp. FSL H7-0308]|uniref:HSP20 family protein n=1 Tax=Siminovitchia thermophila TaxID=1245522 RepID=A0ABS2RBW3_9BACI|nr:Hsp20/alpha crystallin family protein [Siminovitchia thermophila]MBM7717089.1 HSP20 family protein [Siminovitchia thermophila]ONK25119.1 heat-shock protein Hsp20 [Bacillus sp. VT-16-64]
MSLVPFDPFRQLDNMRRDLNRLFSTDFGMDREFGIPKVDVYETENEVVATCDLPGLEKKDDVQIHINDQNTLTISGIIQRSNEIKEDRMHKQERFTGRFQRTIPLPSPVSLEGNAKATYKNGVLEIRMPKMQDDGQNRNKIDVDFH